MPNYFEDLIDTNGIDEHVTSLFVLAFIRTIFQKKFDVKIITYLQRIDAYALLYHTTQQSRPVIVNETTDTYKAAFTYAKKGKMYRLPNDGYLIEATIDSLAV